MSVFAVYECCDQPIYRDTRKPHPTANTTAVTATAGHIFGSCERQKQNRNHLDCYMVVNSSVSTVKSFVENNRERQQPTGKRTQFYPSISLEMQLPIWPLNCLRDYEEPKKAKMKKLKYTANWMADEHRINCGRFVAILGAYHFFSPQQIVKWNAEGIRLR